MPPHRPLRERFFEKVLCGHSPSECWQWTAGRSSDGYGVICVGKQRSELAHRVSFDMHNPGMISRDVCVCHSCDNRLCVNPSHLWLGSVTDNNLDRHKKNRSRGKSHAGSANPVAKITEADVIAIRSDTRLQRVIAEQYGITQPTVSDIKRRKNWRNV